MDISPLITDAIPAAYASKMGAFPTNIINCGDGRVGYRVGAAYANLLPVILLHGIGSGSASWVHQLAALSLLRTTLAWDTPGYGETSPVHSPCPVAADYAAVLAASLSALAIRRCILVGHSLGAIIATAFAKQYPSNVAGLLLLSPANGYAAADPDLRVSKRDARLAMLDTLGPQGMAEKRSSNMLSANASAEAQEWVKWNMSRVIPAGYRQATHLLANSNLCGDLSLFRGRVQVVVGADDVITPPDVCKRVAGASQTILSVIPQAGHAGYVEQPVVYTSCIEQFCRRCESLGER